MQLTINPCNKNNYPLRGIIIKGNIPSSWLKELNDLQFSLSQDVFALPGNTPNSIWGCLAVYDSNITVNDSTKHEICQQVNNLLYISEFTDIKPQLTSAEIKEIFLNKIHLFHPEIGLVELQNPINWEELLAVSPPREVTATQPSESIFIPTSIIAFHKQAISKDELQKELDKPVKPQKLDSKPLSLAEKAKLKAYKVLFSNSSKEDADIKKAPSPRKSEIGKFLGGIMNSIENSFPQLGQMTEGMIQDMEELEKRNQKELDKFLDLMKENPEEALKYAIPLDNNGSERGQGFGQFSMTRMRNEFSLFGLENSNSSGGFSSTESFLALTQQYNKTAEKLIAEKKFEKAAFVYMKLLKNHRKAAETLENGKFYEQAAFIYLKYAKDKKKASECYEKGLFYDEAIELYIETKRHEKAGDLFVKMNKQEDAKKQYNLLAEEYEGKSQFVKASLVYKNKLQLPEKGQEKLLEGWNATKDALNCLNNYFNNITDDSLRINAINSVHTDHTDQKNKSIFLQVIKHEFKKGNTIAPAVREIAYQIISDQSKYNKDIIDQLQYFNEPDKELKNDIIRYRIGSKKRKH